jgi:hypothetical protein
MGEWERIRSAPKNGQPFLAYCPEGEDGEPHWAVCFFSMSRSLCFDTGGFAGDVPDFKPTHWMPLPEPPEARGDASA